MKCKYMCNRSTFYEHVTHGGIKATKFSLYSTNKYIQYSLNVNK